MTATPRVVIVGAGLMGCWHAHAARQAGGRVVAVVDVDPRRAAELARRSRAAILPPESWAELSDADVAHICTPLASHASLAAAALEAGLHVVVEKPLARTLVETRHVLDVARDRGRQIMPVHQFPQQPGMRRLIEMRQSLGEPVRIAYTAYTAGGDGRDALGRRAVMLEILPHAVSLCHALGYAHVAELGWSFPTLTDDDLAAVSASGGVELAIRISLRARPSRNQLEFAARGGSADVDLYHGYAVMAARGGRRRDKLLAPFRSGFKGAAAAGVNLLGRLARNEPAYPGLRRLIKGFYQSLDGGHPPISEGEMLDAAAFCDLAASQYAQLVPSAS